MAEIDLSQVQWDDQPGAAPEVDLSQVTWDETGRQLGLTARYAVEGPAQVAGIFADPIGVALSKITGQPYQPLSQYVSEGLTKMGFPEPETATERVVGGMSRAVTGGGAAQRVAQVAQSVPGVTGQVAELITRQPRTQLASMVTGSGAAEVTREAGGGPGAQIAAGLAGSLAPGAVSGAPAAVRGSFRGGETGRQRVAENIATFEGAAKRAPSVGQATESRLNRSIESLLARTPGGSGAMARRAEQLADDLGASVSGMADDLAPRSDIAFAGRQIKRSITGEGGFVDQFKTRQETLYNKLDQFIPRDKEVGVSRTLQAIDDLNAEIPGAKAVSQLFKNAKIESIGQKLREDLGTPSALGPVAQRGLPYEAVKKLRTLVGREIADNTIMSDVPRSKWKALYAALSDDLGQAAEDAGQPAVEAWNRANTYSRAGMERIETLSGIVDAQTPERIFQSAISGTREGATTINTVMKSLNPQAQRTVTATVLKRLGTALPSQQDDTGARFSTSTFLTNWGKLSPQAKRALFEGKGYGDQFVNDLNKVARVAANLREGSAVFANPSRTSDAMLQATTIGGLLMATMTGQLGTAATIATGMGAANLSARLMTNPRFVHWLAKTSEMPVGALTAQTYVLKGIADQTGDASLAEAADALRALQQNEENQ